MLNNRISCPNSDIKNKSPPPIRYILYKFHEHTISSLEVFVKGSKEKERKKKGT